MANKSKITITCNKLPISIVKSTHPLVIIHHNYTQQEEQWILTDEEIVFNGCLGENSFKITSFTGDHGNYDANHSHLLVKFTETIHGHA